MKQQDIQNLIERFLDAETTLQEEQQLMEYFRQDNIPEELMQYREMFLDYEALATSGLHIESDYTVTPHAAITTIRLSRIKQPPRYMLWAVAASVILIAGAVVAYYYNVDEAPKIVKTNTVKPAKQMLDTATTVQTNLLAAQDKPTPKPSKISPEVKKNSKPAEELIGNNEVIEEPKANDGLRAHLAVLNSKQQAQTEEDKLPLAEFATLLQEAYDNCELNRAAMQSHLHAASLMQGMLY